jgi:hypothetical protein
VGTAGAASGWTTGAASGTEDEDIFSFLGFGGSLLLCGLFLRLDSMTNKMKEYDKKRETYTGGNNVTAFFLSFFMIFLGLLGYENVK